MHSLALIMTNTSHYGSPAYLRGYPQIVKWLLSSASFMPSICAASPAPALHPELGPYRIHIAGQADWDGATILKLELPAHLVPL